MIEKIEANVGLPLIEIPILLLSIVIFTLEIVIISTIKDSASISLSEISNGLSSNGLMIGDIVLTVIAWLMLLAIWIIIYQNKNDFLVLAIFVFTILIMIKEAIIFKLLTCFNYANNDIFIARSSLNFIFAISVLMFLVISVYKKPPNTTDKLIIKLFQILCMLTTAASLLVVFILNIVLLVQLKQPLPLAIGASKINIGYFNQTEITAIKNNSYVKDGSFDQRVISTLSDVIYSKNKTLSYVTCSRKSCTYFYLHTVS